MRLNVVPSPSGGSIIEFETAKEYLTEDAIFRRRNFERKVTPLMKEVMAGMPHYKRKLEAKQRRQREDS